MALPEDQGRDEFAEAEALYKSVRSYLSKYFVPARDRREEQLIEELHDLLLALKQAFIKRKSARIAKVSMQVDLRIVELFERRMGRRNE